ncbi:MAG: M23 family metallopeptidase [Elusimicrobia bacterium]|nr:M23 family metallopeptidase [Elusimicrobiota bacterium]
MMKKIFLIKTIFLTFILILGCNIKPDKAVLSEWKELETSVRDQKIIKKNAELKLKSLLKKFSSFENLGFREIEWAFPVLDKDQNLSKEKFSPDIEYGPYGVKGYDFFDGNRHGGHPAYDIFVPDNNLDSINDKTGKYSSVAAVTDMLVLSLNNDWKPGSNLRGGNYIWLINPKEKKLFYYAHLNEIFVKEGEFIKGGQVLGNIGRTGFLAYKKSSPTHLHLMVLDYKNGNLKPFDYSEKYQKKENSKPR